MVPLSVQGSCLVGSVLYQNRQDKQWRSGPSKQARPEALAAVTEMWRRAGELTASIFTLSWRRRAHVASKSRYICTKPNGVTPHKTALLCQRCFIFMLPRGTNWNSITYRTYARADHFKNLHQTQISKFFKTKQFAKGRIGLFSALLWTAPPNLWS
jgi:hypothetical protein